MQYALLIYQAEEVMENWSEADLKEDLTGHGRVQEKPTPTRQQAYQRKEHTTRT